jgi:hypothetical protein
LRSGKYDLKGGQHRLLALGLQLKGKETGVPNRKR